VRVLRHRRTLGADEGPAETAEAPA
jgi:hypothetical protein